MVYRLCSYASNMKSRDQSQERQARQPISEAKSFKKDCKVNIPNETSVP